MQSTFIMYGVMLLTVFVDLIVAVGLGVFISNIIIIERLSREQAKQVKAISDAEDDVPLTAHERDLLEQTNGKVLFFYLSGPMIFSVSKAIARQHTSINKYQAMILDLSDVPMIDVTVALALENAIKDAIDARCQVFVLCPHQDTQAQLDRLSVSEMVPKSQFLDSRQAALEAALNVVESTQLHA
jgi:SulP family sulfate permease